MMKLLAAEPRVLRTSGGARTGWVKRNLGAERWGRRRTGYGLVLEYVVCERLGRHLLDGGLHGRVDGVDALRCRGEGELLGAAQELDGVQLAALLEEGADGDIETGGEGWGGGTRIHFEEALDGIAHGGELPFAAAVDVGHRDGALSSEKCKAVDGHVGLSAHRGLHVDALHVGEG